MAKKNEEKADFDFTQALEKIDDWDWKKEAFKRYIFGLGIEIKSEKEFEKQYKEFYGGE